MLELINVKKNYSSGENTVEALKGINLHFRKSEFVSILGPSGCGKTTMLNIIGGLDRATDGDLKINGISTKQYKDRDWDSYRNHSIGFVFQTYNLIPHQTVLANVELALTLSGVSKAQRRQRAKEALCAVGLDGQFNKKPSQMSGGQMQRVAIARALVNNPDIILADEPTGALDTTTSEQVMEILKEVSKDRLVIMVTHNPELAQRYSTRIIKMLDGEITDDNMPHKAEPKETTEKKKEKKPSMKFSTSFSLSLKNLFTKKGRTILTSFAGSIGIIGIALIFALSQGFTTYIDMVQESTLSSYPLTIESSTMDLSTVMQTFMNINSENVEHKKDKVYVKPAMYDMINALNNVEETKNDLKSFKAYIEKRIKSDETLNDAINGVQYTYDFDLMVYTKNVDGEIIRSDTKELLQELMAEYMDIDMSALLGVYENYGITTDSPMMSMMGGNSFTNVNLWSQMLSGKDGKVISPLIQNQYDVIYGSWPNSYDEIVLVVDENNELDDLTLYALGLTSKEQAANIVKSAIGKENVVKNNDSWSYKDICGMEFRTVLNSDCYSYDATSKTYSDLRTTQTGLRYLYDNGIKLKVTGIIRQNEDTDQGMISGSIAYTHLLTEHVINNAKGAKPIKAQLDNPSVDIFTGLPFNENKGNLSEKEKKAEFKKYVNNLSDTEKANVYVKVKSIPEQKDVDAFVEQQTQNVSRDQIEQTMLSSLTQEMTVDENQVKDYIESMSDEELDELYEKMLAQAYKTQYAQTVEQQLATVPQQQKVALLENEIDSYTAKQCAVFYDEVMEFSESTYEDNLRSLGHVSLDNPHTINLFASTFENKDIIEEAIEKYNEGVDELQKIKYVDYIGIMMSSITTIINTITYVLIAFVAISLIVSSIMIGVITLISVQERTKEIGILRSIGASKKDVSAMFNAETLIIGFTSGALGVLVTYLLCLPINAIIHALTGITNLNAYLPIHVAIVLVVISMLLTLFAGVIPSRSAAKKDPVIALRTE